MAEFTCLIQKKVMLSLFGKMKYFIDATMALHKFIAQGIISLEYPN